VQPERFVTRLADARIGRTFNFYRNGRGAALRRARLREYLRAHERTELLLVGEAAGYRGARISGIPFTSERQLTGSGPAEATATIVRRTLAELALEALCWNVVPTHPGTSTSNRRPSRAEVAASLPFLAELAQNRIVLAVGRLAAEVTDAPYLRHPAYGGAAEFRAGLLRFAAGGRPERRLFDEMKTFNAKPGEIAREWYVVDAEGQTLGRLATRIADTLRGKGKPAYTPHVDTGDFVIVVNANKIRVTGNKLDQKRYYRHSGYPGGLRSRSLREEMERHPEEVLRRAVKGMLPKNRLARQQITKLKIYSGPEHPHGPQAPQPLTWEDGT
jgi:large subunit ribosomal protein L13